MTDGTAKFIVRDMRCKYRTGEIVALYGEPQAWDYLLLCDGSTVSADNYPELCSVLGGNVLPNLIDRVLQGGSVSGQYKGAGLPNITGAANYYSLINSASIIEKHGALSTRFPNLHVAIGTGTVNMYTYVLDFNASWFNTIYGNSSTVQPPAMTIKYYICYA